MNNTKIKTHLINNAKTAEENQLIYVSDSQKGISRIRKNKRFIYLNDNKVIRDKQIIDRINRLAIPPAWKEVWICLSPKGHIQATGKDAAGRKQYIYHPKWKELRSETKFSSLYEFGEKLPLIRRKLKSDLNQQELNSNKVMATIVSLMENTGIRIGNNSYEKLYGSIGATTLKDNHVKVNGSELKFSFTGKKGIEQNISLKSKKLAHIVRQCKSIPGKELFQYYDENNERKPVDSGMVNEYLKEISGNNFSAKDFRTWNGTLCALEELLKAKDIKNETQGKKIINEVLDSVAEKLGNTRTVCKKYYVHPALLDHFSNKTLPGFINGSIKSYRGLNATEKLLMAILHKMKK